MEKSEKIEGSLFEVAGKKLACVHCEGERFVHSESLSQLAGMFSPHAEARPGYLNILSCCGCGGVALFNAKVAKLDEILECCECGAAIPVNSDKCGKCGWTYKAGER